MAKRAPLGAPFTVALTGATGDFGALLLPRLAADSRVERIIAFGPRSVVGPKVDFQRLDLTHPEADREMAESLRGFRVQALYHLAQLLAPVRDPVFAHELEVAGTARVLAAMTAAGVRRLVVPSFTAVYGASAKHPALLREGTLPLGCSGSRFISDKLEIEAAVHAFAKTSPDIHAIVLRFAAPLGPTLENPVTRFLRHRYVPTLMGYDPRWQAIHAEDVSSALHLALHTEARGTFNIVGRGVLPLSQLIAAAGGQAIPLPAGIAQAALVTLRKAGGLGVPLPLLDFLRHGWIADGTRAEAELGFQPRHHAREAAASLHRT